MVGGALTEMSWRLAFLVNVPIGLLVIYLACSALRETEKERMKLDASRGVLATLACTAAVFCMSTGAGAWAGCRPSRSVQVWWLWQLS